MSKLKILIIFSLCQFLIHGFPLDGQLDFNYHNYEAMEKFLKNFTNSYPNLTNLYNIGQSRQGRNLYVVEITSPKESLTSVPNVKLIGNIHGNEAVGREVLLHFIDFLVSNYSKDKNITWLLDNTRIHILPSLNPDGFERATEGICERGKGRENSFKIDLNRNFPDFFKYNGLPIQPETNAVQEWMSKIPFILSASLHGGALVANYPLENHRDHVFDVRKPSISPDDDVFQYLAKVYANAHPFMHKGQGCPHDVETFKGGITNGAEWYPVTGGMQDYNYMFHGCMEITMEISCCKYPFARDLPVEWKNNKEALFKYITQAHQGVRGLVLDSTNNQTIGNATLYIDDRNISFRTTPEGEFWRILLPGSYKLKVEKEEYHTVFKVFEVQNITEVYPKLTDLYIRMTPLGMQPVSEIGETSYITQVSTVVPTITDIDSTITAQMDLSEHAHASVHNQPSNVNNQPLSSDESTNEYTVAEAVYARSSSHETKARFFIIIFSVVMFIFK